MICSTAAIDCSARWNYARNNGKDLDFYVYLMRKSVNYTHPCGMSETHILWMWLLRSVEIASFEPEYSLRLPVILKGGHSPSIHSWITFRVLIFRQDAGHEM